MLPTTAYARLTRRQARAVLGGMVLALAAAVAVTFSPLSSTNLVERPDRQSDVALYRAKIDRMQRGEGYYEATAAEMTARGYPTRSVFNWRTPLPIWLIGKMPTPELGKTLLGGLAFALLLAAFAAMARDGGPDAARSVSRHCGVPWQAVAVALLLTGPLMFVILGDLFVMPVLWAGILIGLSVSAYGLGRPGWGVAFGLAAVACRELAMPYCAVCVAMAWHQNRRRELAAWMLGLSVWLAFYSLHCWHVRGLMTPEGHAHREGWVQFGGIGFVISTIQMNAYLLVLPQWVSAVYLVACLVGLAGWSTPLGTRVALSTCLFLIAFAAVGHRFNQYWGSLIAPLLCFGVARFPASLRDLWRAPVRQTRGI